MGDVIPRGGSGMLTEAAQLNLDARTAPDPSALPHSMIAEVPVTMAYDEHCAVVNRCSQDDVVFKLSFRYLRSVRTTEDPSAMQ